MSNDPTLASALKLVQRIAGLPALTHEEVGRALGVQLQQLPTEPGSRLEYEGALVSGPFVRVEVHEPSAGQAGFWLVALYARPELDVKFDGMLQSGVIDRDAPMQVEPNGPPGGSITFEAAPGNHQKILYQFRGDDHRLRAIAVHRGAGIP